MIKSPQHITYKVMLWAIFISFFLNSLPAVVAQQKCSTPLILAEKQLLNQAVKEKEFENWLLKKKSMASNGLKLRTSELIQIPVIFHVIHKGETLGSGVNVSKEVIDEQLITLNRDFNQQNVDAASTLQVFKGLAANIEFEFVYAKQTPDGYPTNGVTRQIGNQINYSYSQRETLASENFWPPEDYLNIWITDIKSPSLGWAEFPSTTLPGINEGAIKVNADGIAIDYQYIGNNPNSPSFESKGRTLTHEMGHFFGLRHIWGDGGCNADDYCSDTPEASESSSGCNLEKSTCSSLDMVQNFMDYTDDACMTLFTQDQKLRMRTVLENSPRRSSLINSIALNAPPVFASDASILLSKPSAYRSSCSNIYIPSIIVRNLGTDTLKAYTVRLYNNSQIIESIALTERPLASGEETKVIFNELLTNEIINKSLRYNIIINGVVDERLENNEKIEYIQSLNTQNLPYQVEFSNNIADWFIRNPDNQEGWTVTKDGVYLPTFKKRSNVGQTDALVSPIYDFTSIDIPELSIIYAQSDDSIQNSFSIYASYDCGETFQDLIFSKASDEIVSAYTTNQAFIPQYRLDWDTLKIDLARMRNEASVSFKIELENRGANNFYLNSISIKESATKDREITPVGWNRTNAVYCNSAISSEILLRNTGRSAVTSFRLLLRDGNRTLLDKLVNKVILPQQTISFPIDSIEVEKDRGIVIAIIQTENGINPVVKKSITLNYLNNCSSELPPLGFDLAQNSENNLEIINPNNDKSWEYDNDVNMLNSNSSDISIPNSEDWLVSPIIDVSELDNVSLIFDIAYQKPFQQSEGLFIVLQPTDSINTEQVIYAKSGDSLATTFSNNPEEELVTRNELVDLSSYLYLKKFRIIFKASHQNGANIYLNDISLFLGQDLPPDYPQTQKPFVIYPNPVRDGLLKLHFNLPIAEAGTVTITDTHGKVVRQFYQPKIVNQYVLFNFSDLASGLYILHFNSPSIQKSEKFIVE